MEQVLNINSFFLQANWEMVGLKDGKELEEKGKERCLHCIMLNQLEGGGEVSGKTSAG